MQKIITALNIISIYFYFTGLFKLTKPKNDVTTYRVEKQYNKLVFIILDGLRIDAVCKTNHKSLYHNNLTFLHELNRSNKKTFLSVAGLPTATSIRVRSILTGVSSNFLNGTDTFTHKIIEEDSIINKIKDESFYFYGDDTWVDLFPIIKGRCSTIPAYGKDRTMESEKKIMNKLVYEIGEYKYAFAHLSLLDCYGHDYSIYSTEVRSILLEYNKMIESIYNKIDDDTLFVILSDHGVNDDGSHGGGNIKEISSVGIFLSKKEFLNFENDECKKIRDNYLSKLYGSNFDWINTVEEIDIIHQNDIVPTVCILMGLSVPFNCIGNLLYEFIGENRKVYYNLIMQKFNSINIVCKNFLHDYTFEQLHKLSYEISDKIYDTFSGINYVKLAISFLCMLLCINLCIRKQNIKNYFQLPFLFTYFVIFMVAHSVYSFIHEDLLWGILFLINDFTSLNLYFLLFYLSIGKYPQHDEDRFFKYTKIENYFTGNLLFLKIIISFYILLYYNIYKPILKKKAKIFNFIKNFIFKKELIIILYKYLNKESFEENKLSIFCMNVSFKNLGLIIYDPPTLFLTHVVLNYLPIKNTIQGFALANMSFFYMGMNYALSSINYKIAFTFEKNFNVYLGYILMLFYFLYPRSQTYRYLKKDTFLLLSALNAFASMIVGLWFVNNFLFYFFFGGKCFFVCSYFVIENLLLFFL
ncbi:mannose-ethanolamine phosphotransferase gpi13 [Conglomerata obtusa]